MARPWEDRYSVKERLRPCYESDDTGFSKCFVAVDLATSTRAETQRHIKIYQTNHPDYPQSLFEDEIEALQVAEKYKIDTPRLVSDHRDGHAAVIATTMVPGRHLGHFLKSSHSDPSCQGCKSPFHFKSKFRNGFTGDNAINLLVGLARNLAKMHKAGLAHRDIKPDNLVWDPATETVSVVDLASGGRCGGIERPPEKVIDSCSDVWMFGVLFLQMQPELWAKANLANCLDPDPEKRPTMEMVAHALIKHNSPVRWWKSGTHRFAGVSLILALLFSPYFLSTDKKPLAEIREVHIIDPLTASLNRLRLLKKKDDVVGMLALWDNDTSGVPDETFAKSVFDSGHQGEVLITPSSLGGGCYSKNALWVGRWVTRGERVALQVYIGRNLVTYSGVIQSLSYDAISSRPFVSLWTKEGVARVSLPQISVYGTPIKQPKDVFFYRGSQFRDSFVSGVFDLEDLESIAGIFNFGTSDDVRWTTEIPLTTLLNAIGHQVQLKILWSPNLELGRITYEGQLPKTAEDLSQCGDFRLIFSQDKLFLRKGGR